MTAAARLAAALMIGAAACTGGGGDRAAADFRQGAGLFAVAKSAQAAALVEIADAGRGDRYDAAVLEVFAGEVSQNAKLKVRKAERLATDPRHRPHAAGERLVLLLNQEERDGWRTAGAYGEGELPADDTYVYLVGHFVEGLDVRRYPLDGAEVAGQRIELDLFRDAIAGAARCFGVAGGTNAPDCTAGEIAAYRARSPLHEYLAAAADADRK